MITVMARCVVDMVVEFLGGAVIVLDKSIMFKLLVNSSFQFIYRLPDCFELIFSPLVF